MDPAEALLKRFSYDHLPEHLHPVSAIFATAAQDIIRLVVPGPDRTVAMRKLWEAKNEAVIANLYAK